MAIMLRCDATASDGRRCTAPDEHDDLHLLAPAQASREQATKIALRWGYSPRAAKLAVNGAMDAGVVQTDTFVRMLQISAAAGIPGRLG